MRSTSEVSSSGIDAVSSRHPVSTSRAASPGKNTSPPRTVGPTGCSAYSSDVTTPKLPPPPRSAQNRSLFSSALAWTRRPSAVTTSAPTRLSQVRPCLRSSQPMPPPRVKPPSPVVETRPPVTASPNAWVSWSKSAQVAPPCATARRRLRVDRDGLHRREVEDDPAVAGGEPGDAVRAAAYRERQALAAGELHRLDHVGGAGAADDQRRMLVVRGVPDRTCLVVVAVARSDHLTADRSLQLAHRGFAHHVRRFCRRHWPLLGIVENGQDVMRPRLRNRLASA